MKRAVVVIAAGKIQIPIIKKAKELGFFIISIDKNPKAPGFAYSDEKIVLSTYEAEPIIKKLANMKNYDIIGILNRSAGPPVVTTSIICKALGLPGVEETAAEIIVNKDLLRNFCKSNFLKSSWFQIVSSPDQSISSNISFPCVVKPALSIIGKSGVCKVENRNDLDRSISDAFSTSFSGKICIEEYIQGKDISLISFVQNGKLLPLVLVDEINKIAKNGEVSGAGYAVPSVYSNSSVEYSIISLAQKIVDLLSIQNSPFMMACRVDEKNNLHLIEIHLDIGGDLVLDGLLPNSSSFDFYALVVKLALGIENTVPEIVYKPVAIFYGSGTELISDRPYKIIKANDRNELEELILKKSGVYY